MYPTRAICLVGVLVWSAWDHVQSTHARNVAGIEINLESFNHRNIRSNFTICQKIQGSFISFLTKVLNSVGWIWSIIFSNECWHLIHVLLLTVYGTYSKNYMHFEKVILLLWNSNFDKAITNRSEPPKHSKYYQPSFWRELHHCQGRNLLLTSVFSPSFQLKYQVLFACTEMAIGQEFSTHQWTVKSTLSSWCILLVRCRAVTRLKLTGVVIIPTTSKPFSQTRKTNVLFPEDHIPGSGYSLPGFAQNSLNLC